MPDQSPVLEQLIYYSSARATRQRSDLREILDSAVRNNERLDITGVLLHHQGNFVQVLEGPVAALDATMSKILADPRHHDVMIVYRKAVDHRAFPSWHMGFIAPTLSELKEHPRVVPMRFGKPDFSEIGAAPGDALDMLRMFVEKSR